MSRDMMTYNVHEGNLEAMVHGYRDALLKTDEYNNLCQCDNLSDLKSQLQVTDYGNFLQQETSALTARIIVDKAHEFLLRQFRELRCWSEPPLCHFLDFISYEYMISNVLKLIVAKRSGRSNLELLTKCHPLGTFPELPTLLAAVDVREMFEVVLVDSPVGRFFAAEGFERDLEELSVEFIRGILMKNYYQQFYDFCYELGGETREVMCPLLDAEADRLVLTFTLNTLGMREITPADRKKVFPNLGTLVDIHDDIAESENDEQLRDRLRRFAVYFDLLDDSRSLDNTNKKSVERRFVDLSVGMYNDAMTRQFQYGVFYAYVKLKELEINNLQWIADCVVQQIRNRLHEYVTIVPSA